MSGNVQANEGFYNLFGYVTVCRFFLGDDNPDWTEPPVPIDVVSEPTHGLLEVVNLSMVFPPNR